MSTNLLTKLQKTSIQKKFPRFKAGQTVKVHEKIKEGDKERVQIFQGLILKTGGQGSGKTITVRRIVGGIGVEKIFSIHSSVIANIEITKEAKVRRSKLFFMRERRGKSARLKEKFLTEKDLEAMMPHEVTEEEMQEAVVAQEETKKEKTEQAKVEEKANQEEAEARSTEEVAEKASDSTLKEEAEKSEKPESAQEGQEDDKTQ
jgi:large subunit ribosomal protein L19